MATKILQRRSITLFINSNEQLADQIQDATIAFLRVNYGNVISQIEKHAKPIYINNYIEKDEKDEKKVVT
jgi:hypothetical protein